MSKNDKERHPKVFISYSHDSPEHADKILEFANKLRSEGIDAILDQYEPWPEKGWAQWMLQQVSEADLVLMICTEMYYKGVMDKLAPGEKRGIKYEWNLINNHFYKAGSVNKRFLPAILEKTCVKWIPDPFQAMPWFCVVTDEGYEDLYRRLTNQPKTKRPNLGKLKSLKVREVKIDFFVDDGGDGGEEGVEDGGGDGGGGEERSDHSGRDMRMSEKGRLETLYHITASVGAAAGVVFVIYKMSEENWETTCWWIAGIVALVAGVWATTQMPRRLLNHICCYIFMDKRVARTARWALLTVFVLVLTLVRTTEARGLVAVVDLAHWKHPDAVARGLTTIDGRDLCSMYSIGLRTNSSKGVKKPMLMIPEAHFIEVTKDNVKEIYQDQEILPLPSLRNGEQIDITAWATCKAERPNAERVRITHLGGRPAHLDIRNPVTALAQLVNQHVYIVWSCIGVAICAVLAVVIKLFGWLHHRKPTETISQNS